MTRAVCMPAVLGLALVALVAPSEVHAKVPSIDQMVVFKSGKAKIKQVRPSGLKATVGRARCAIGTGTPLAALLRSKVAKVGLRDYASCTSRARDGGQIYVQSIGNDRARGMSGWVYKVGHKSASAGAADPAGPFGRGLLRSGQRVTWYYGTPRGGRFQRTLELGLRAGPAPGTALARVRSYDDDGRGQAESGVTVKTGSATATTGADGSVVIATGAGKRSFVASKAGAIRSFAERLTVR